MAAGVGLYCLIADDEHQGIAKLVGRIDIGTGLLDNPLLDVATRPVFLIQA